MTLNRLLVSFAAFAAPWFAPAALAQAVVTTEQVRAELVLHAPQGVEAGQPVWLGLQIEHQPDWHTYWKNPGDSGLPTTLTWQLPAGVTAGDIAWPTPGKLPVGPLMNYGYKGKVLLPVPATVTSEFVGKALEVKLSAQWLVCKDVCIPQQGDFTLSVPARASTALHGAAFDAARAAVPQAVAGATARAQLVDGAKTLRVSVSGLPAALQGQALAFFAETAGVIEPAAKVDARWDGWRLARRRAGCVPALREPGTDERGAGRSRRHGRRAGRVRDCRCLASDRCTRRGGSHDRAAQCLRRRPHRR